MKVPIKLLKEFVQIKETPEELAHLFSMHSMPTEVISSLKEPISNVVVGQITNITKHPNADKLQVCKVNVKKEELQILTAATNVAIGQKIPVALVGATLSGGFEIKEATMRGEKSFGMLCSEKELGLTKEAEGILILSKDAPIGQNIVEHLGLDEVILDVELIPNRNDCMSVLGIAREFATILKRPLKEPKYPEPKKQGTSKHRPSVNIKAQDACPRYMAVLLENVKVGPSPEWLQKNLKAAGIRPISNIVDVTNYVLIEQGQPLHAFSFEKLEGGQINVRFAKDGETIETLDGKEHQLDKNTLIIADRKKAQALAGIMGGSASEVHADTKTVLLESAFFDPLLIRNTAKKYGLNTESSARFSKSVDWHGVQKALFRAVYLIKETAGGEIVSELFDKKKKDPTPKQLSLRIERISQILGIDISEQETIEILKHLGFTINTLGDRIDVIVPSWRATDITREIDLIEEVARIIGYSKIPSLLPKKQHIPKMPTTTEKVRKIIKSSLLASGLNEIITYSITSPQVLKKIGLRNEETLNKLTFDMVKQINPLSQETAFLRNSLLPELIMALERNWYRQTYDIKIFEIGTVFHKTKVDENKKSIPLPLERQMVAGIVCGEFLTRPWENIKTNDIDFFALKGIIENMCTQAGLPELKINRGAHPLFHPGKTAVVEGIGIYGAVHPSILRELGITKEAFAFEFDIEGIVAKVSYEKTQQFIPSLPYSRRDVAFLVPEKITFEQIIKTVQALNSELIDDFFLFDRYKGQQVKAGQVSLACAIHYQGKDKTLTDKEVENEHQKVVAALTEKLGAEIRS